MVVSVTYGYVLETGRDGNSTGCPLSSRGVQGTRTSEIRNGPIYWWSCGMLRRVSGVFGRVTEPNTYSGVQDLECTTGGRLASPAAAVKPASSPLQKSVNRDSYMRRASLRSRLSRKPSPTKLMASTVMATNRLGKRIIQKASWT